MVVCESIYFVLALIGEWHPEVRYIGYNLVGCVGIKLLSVARQSNIVNCLKGDSIVTFNATCDTWAFIGGFIGMSACTTLLVFGEIDITLCMLLEFAGCLIGHLFQLYANRRIRRDILHVDTNKYTIIDVINDLARVKKRKSQTRHENDNNDSIFDQ